MSPRDIADDATGGDDRTTDLDAVLGRAAPDRLAALALLYLTLPGLLFLAGWARPFVAVPAATAGLIALAIAWRTAAPAPLRLLPHLAPGLAWAATTGALHVVFAVDDWQIRDAVLRDLADGPWPVIYRAADGAGSLLRAPLGYYLPAGLAGQVLGYRGAEVALWAWTGLGLAVVLALLASLGRALSPRRPRRAAALLIGVFVLFHGLDVLPNLVLDMRAGVPCGLGGRGGEWWSRAFQYTGHVTAALWVPNHAVPAWIAALLILRHGAHPAFVRALPLALAGLAFWTPVAAVGAAVVGGAVALRGGMRSLLRAARSARAILAVGYAAPILLYMVAGAGAVPHFPLFSAMPFEEALGRWGCFLLVEVLVWAGLAAALVRGTAFAASVALLVLLPLYVFGPGNEATSRGGLVPVAVLAVTVAAALLRRPAGGGQRWARRGLFACLVLAALGAAGEASVVFTRRPWDANPACSLPEAARQSVFAGSTDWSHYLAPWPDSGLRRWLRDAAPRPVPAEDDGVRCFDQDDD